MAMRFSRLAAFDPRIRLVADSIRPRALSNLKTLFGKLCCTTLRVVIPTTRSNYVCRAFLPDHLLHDAPRRDPYDAERRTTKGLPKIKT